MFILHIFGWVFLGFAGWRVCKAACLLAGRLIDKEFEKIENHLDHIDRVYEKKRKERS